MLAVLVEAIVSLVGIGLGVCAVERQLYRADDDAEELEEFAPALLRELVADSSRPNIVLIIIDTLRADKLGVYGASEQASPEIDALARRGVRFSRVVASSSWTRPSMGALLTSLHPRTLGLYSMKNDSLADRFDTLPEILQRNGYVTIGATANPNVNQSFNFHQGFDRYFDSRVLWTWMPPQGARPNRGNTPLPAASEVFEKILQSVDALGQGPFFVQAVIMEVHEAFVIRGPKGVIGKVQPAILETAYADSVRRVSKAVDGFVRNLSERPGWKDTVFVITSDHGQGITDHPSIPRSMGTPSIRG